jgi:hypothetical protein
MSLLRRTTGNLAAGKRQMKRLTFITVVSILASFLAGCARPCFYQAGKNIEQSERDLLQCIRQANESRYIPQNALFSSPPAGMRKGHQLADLTCSCMRARGYEYLDANNLTPERRRIMVVAPFQTYWVVDGAGVASQGRATVSEQKEH